MAISFNEPPLDEPMVDKQGKLTPQWRAYQSSFYNTIIAYLTQYGDPLPQITTLQMNSIVDPPYGLTAFNTTLGKAVIYLSSGWQTITTS